MQHCKKLLRNYRHRIVIVNAINKTDRFELCTWNARENNCAAARKRKSNAAIRFPGASNHALIEQRASTLRGRIAAAIGTKALMRESSRFELKFRPISGGCLIRRGTIDFRFLARSLAFDTPADELCAVTGLGIDQKRATAHADGSRDQKTPTNVFGKIFDTRTSRLVNHRRWIRQRDSSIDLQCQFSMKLFRLIEQTTVNNSDLRVKYISRVSVVSR